MCTTRSRRPARRADSAARQSLVDDLHALRETLRGRAAHLPDGFPRYFGGVRGFFPTGSGVYRHIAPLDQVRSSVPKRATSDPLRSAISGDNRRAGQSICPYLLSRGKPEPRAAPRGDHIYRPMSSVTLWAWRDGDLGVRPCTTPGGHIHCLARLQQVNFYVVVARPHRGGAVQHRNTLRRSEARRRRDRTLGRSRSCGRRAGAGLVPQRAPLINCPECEESPFGRISQVCRTARRTRDICDRRLGAQ